MAGERPETLSKTPASQGRGCLFWALVTAVVLAVTVGAGGYLAYRYVIARVTDATPLDLGAPTLSLAERARLDGRIAAFVHALRNKNPVEPLVLSAEEVTALAARSPELRRLGIRTRFSIGERRVRVEFSVPLERMGHSGRWLNGSAAFAVRLKNGVLVVNLRSVSVKGEPVPVWIVERLGERNLADDINQRPLVGGLISRLESIEVGNGYITLVPRLRR